MQATAHEPRISHQCRGQRGFGTSPDDTCACVPEFPGFDEGHGTCVPQRVRSIYHDVPHADSEEDTQQPGSVGPLLLHVEAQAARDVDDERLHCDTAQPRVGEELQVQRMIFGLAHGDGCAQAPGVGCQTKVPRACSPRTAKYEIVNAHEARDADGPLLRLAALGGNCVACGLEVHVALALGQHASGVRTAFALCSGRTSSAASPESPSRARSSSSVRQVRRVRRHACDRIASTHRLWVRRVG